jgi:hypothetical protein
VGDLGKRRGNKSSQSKGGFLVEGTWGKTRDEVRGLFYSIFELKLLYNMQHYLYDKESTLQMGELERVT